MQVYFVRSADPMGGFFSIYENPVVASEERATIIEIRRGEFPDQTLADIYAGGIVECHPVYCYDATIIPYWDQAEVWWTREGGYVT